MFMQVNFRVIPSSFLLLIVFVLAFVSNGDAIKCFVCDSSDNPSCADLKSNSSIVPEECSLDKMNSIDTWLVKMNKISYFDKSGAKKSTLMNCQKVVNRDPKTSKMITARFCQIEIGDSMACDILRTKLKMVAALGYDNSENEKQDNEEEFHCSVCNTDRCNGSERLMALTGSAIFLAMVLILQQRILW